LSLFFSIDSGVFPHGWRKDILEEQKQAMASAGFSEAKMKMVLGGNAERLFDV